MTRAAPDPANISSHRATITVYSLWVALTAAALLAGFGFLGRAGPGPATASSPLSIISILGILTNAALPALGTLALLFAVGRARGRTRVADGFYPLVLLNPVLFARSAGPFDETLLATGLLALMAGAILVMKENHARRYLVVAILAAMLARLSETFILLMPAIVAWLLYAGYALAKSGSAADRKRGLVVMIAAEVGLLVFGLACILIDATATPEPNTLFTSIVSFIEFPLLVIAIVMLSLGWRRGPGGKAPPYFAGMLVLLLGLLGMLLNNFQTGMLRAPGADQTVFILCLVYTVFALHGPRRLQWFVPPILLVGAVAYTFFR